MHWHGLRLETRYDGVPHETQAPIPVGGEFPLLAVGVLTVVVLVGAEWWAR